MMSGLFLADVKIDVVVTPADETYPALLSHLDYDHECHRRFSVEVL